MGADEWMLVLAALAVVAAVISFVVAIGANKRADQALDLQARIDDRAREFRHVSWELTTTLTDHGIHSCRLVNTGLTAAEDVVLVLELLTLEMHELGSLDPGEWKEVQSRGVATYLAQIRESMPVYIGYSVHWSSPLGEVERFHRPPMQLF